MKIVINKCFGGFGISTKAMIELIKRGSKAVKKMDVKEYYGGNNPNFKHRDWEEEYKKDLAECTDVGDGFKCRRFIETLYKDGFAYHYSRDAEHRTDKHLIAVVQEMREKANGPHASLKIVNIPKNVNWEIDDYDGVETVHEKHRSW